MRLAKNLQLPIAWLTPTKIQVGTDSRNSLQISDLSSLACSVIREANGTKKFSQIEVAAVKPLIDQGILLEADLTTEVHKFIKEIKVEIAEVLDYQNSFSEIFKFYGFERLSTRKSDPKYSHAELSVVTGFSSLILSQNHLLVNFIGDSILLGPLVIPGKSSCVNCLFLHRKDKNRLWPAVALNFDNSPRFIGSPQLKTAANFAARVISNYVTNNGINLQDQILEINLKEFFFELRDLAPHPKCGCK